MTARERALELVGPSLRLRLDLDAEADLERCGALKDFWYVACLSRELGSGKPLARTIFSRPLVLFRGKEGGPVALRDRCLHRAAPLSGGKVQNGCLQCPYHGWTYDETGRVVEVPSLGPRQRAEKLGGGEHKSASLCSSVERIGSMPAYSTLEQDGLVFVFMGGDRQRARRPPFQTPHWNEPGWRTYYMVTRFANGVTHLAENFMDVPHTVFVHGGWFRRRKRKRVLATVRRGAGEVLITYHQPEDALAGLGRVLNPAGAPVIHTDHYFAPHVTQVDYAFGKRSGLCITSQCTPVGPKDSWVYTAIGFRMPADLPGAFLARMLEPLLQWYTRRVITQDVDIMSAQATRLDGPMDANALLGTEADLPHRDIESCRAWLSGGGEGEGPDPRERDVVLWI